MTLTNEQIDRIRVVVQHAEFQDFQPEHQAELVKHIYAYPFPHSEALTSMGRAIAAAITETLEQEKENRT